MNGEFSLKLCDLDIWHVYAKTRYQMYNIFMTAVTGAAGNFIALSSKLSCNVLKILYVIFLWEVQLCTLEMEVSVIMENLEYLWASIIQQV